MPATASRSTCRRWPARPTPRRPTSPASSGGAFGETPHQYLMTRRLERAAALLRSTDHSVADICMEVGLSSVGSFTTSFRRSYEMTPTEYRAAYPPAARQARIPTCFVMAAARPAGSKARVPMPLPSRQMTLASGAPAGGGGTATAISEILRRRDGDLLRQRDAAREQFWRRQRHSAQ